MKKMNISYESLVDTISGMSKEAQREFLLTACLNADLHLCQVCLDAKVDFKIGDKYGKPFFLDYVESPRANPQVIDWLIDNGLDIDYGPSYGTPLNWACMYGKPEIVVHLVNKRAKFTPLMEGSNHGTDIYCTVYNSANLEGRAYEITKLLLKKGAPLNAKNPDKFNPLYVSVRYKKGAEFVKLFLQYGVPVNIIVNRVSLLNWAVRNDDLDTARVLLENNADVNARVENSDWIKECHGALNSMDIAIFNKNEKMQVLLAEYGGVATSKTEKLDVLFRLEYINSELPNQDKVVLRIIQCLVEDRDITFTHKIPKQVL